MTTSLTKPTVHVVDDDDSFRNAVSRLIRAAGHEVRSYPSAVEFLAAEVSDQPGCVVLDLQMPGLSGLELQDAFAKSGNPLPIVFITGHGDIPTSVHAVKQGAEDFLTKPVRKELLLAAIERALKRDTLQRAQSLRRSELNRRYVSLTPREREVLALIIAGKLNKQIAAELGTVERTVKAHRAKVMEKMQVTSLAALVQAAAEVGR